MHDNLWKSKENKNGAVVNSISQQKKNIKQGVRFIDNRSESVVKERMQSEAINTPRVKQLITLNHKVNDLNIIQLVKWTWGDGKWIREDGTPGVGPRRPGVHEGETVEYDEPKPLLSLNLGAGRNPMVNHGFINLEYSKDDAKKGREENNNAEYILADATKPLPFRSGVFDEVHAVNPFGFNPISKETSRVMTSTGVLSVTGNGANKYAKNTGDAHQDPERVGLYQNGISGMIAAHNFGIQSRTGGKSALDTSSSLTRSYVKGKEITLSEAANSSNPQLKKYYDLYIKLVLGKMTEREQGYQDDYADDDEYLEPDDLRDLSYLREKFGRLAS